MSSKINIYINLQINIYNMLNTNVEKLFYKNDKNR